MDISKEQRKHVRKHVYAFKVSDSIGSFTITFSDNVTKLIPMTDKLNKLFVEVIEQESFVEQFYTAKLGSELNKLQFIEYDEQAWRKL